MNQRAFESRISQFVKYSNNIIMMDTLSHCSCIILSGDPDRGVSQKPDTVITPGMCKLRII